MFLLILSKNIFFQELELKTTTSKFMEEIFMTNQLMTWLTNTYEIRKISTGEGDDYATCYCWILLISKAITD